MGSIIHEVLVPAYYTVLIEIIALYNAISAIDDVMVGHLKNIGHITPFNSEQVLHREQYSQRMATLQYSIHT